MQNWPEALYERSKLEESTVTINASSTPRTSYTPAPVAKPTTAKVDAKATSAKPEQPKLVDYTIKKGDTLTSIAKAHKTDVETLAKNNPQIKDRDTIYAGSVMKVPAPRTEAPSTKEGAVCLREEAPTARQPATPAVQQRARVAAAGREEMIKRNLERAAKPSTAATPATPTAPTAPTAAATPRAIDTPAARANNTNIAATTQRLVDNGLVTKAQAAELTNGVWSKKDMEIARQASDVTSRVADFAVGQHKEIARGEDAGRLPKGSAKRAEQPVFQALDAKNDSNKLTEGLVQQQSIQQSAELREALKGIDAGDVVRAVLTAPFKDNPVTNLVEGIMKGK